MTAYRTEKRPALYLRDAALVVISLWIVLAGLRCADLAAAESLSVVAFARAIADVTFFVAAAWLTVAGVASLMVRHAGSPIDYPRALTIAGIAAVPVTGAGLVATLLSLFAHLLGFDGAWLTWAVPMVLWIGVVVGSPGWYFALLLAKNTRVQPQVAVATSVFLVAVGAFAVAFFTYVWPF